MANEAQIQVSLQILNGNLIYQPPPKSFFVNVAGKKGPVPGAFTVSVTGTDVNFSELVQPTLCRITNLDTTNYVAYGIYSSIHHKLFLLGEVGPGETYVLKLSRDLGQDYDGPGTGTTHTTPDSLRFLAVGAPVNVVVEAFEA